MYSRAWSKEELEALIDRRIQRVLHRLFRPKKRDGHDNLSGVAIRYWFEREMPDDKPEASDLAGRY